MVNIQKILDSIEKEILNKDKVNSYLPSGITKVNVIKNSDIYGDKLGNFKTPGIFYVIDSIEPGMAEQCIAETKVTINVDVMIQSLNTERAEQDINGYMSALINLFYENTETSEIWDLELGSCEVANAGTPNIKILSTELTGTIRTSN